jgi:hypothetical protein
VQGLPAAHSERRRLQVDWARGPPAADSVHSAAAAAAQLGSAQDRVPRLLAA